MIPTCIKRDHILKAIDELNAEGISDNRRSKIYCLVESEHYPPKYLISLGHRIATGELLSPGSFNGGKESNDFLTSLEFMVVKCGCKQPTIPTRGQDITIPPPPCHSEHCKECKVRIRQLLERIYGECIDNYLTHWRARLEDYERNQIEGTLRAIYTALQVHRGHQNFVRSNFIQGCDLYIPKARFAVELDESQHFTYPRKISLSHYPATAPTGFSVDRWIKLCEQLNKKDYNPPDRDEQRAWYDSLRDLLPTTYGLNPTVRIYLADFKWCSLDPQNPENIRNFREMVPALPSADVPEKPHTQPTIVSDEITEKKTFRLAIVFPDTWASSTAGKPPDTPLSQSPKIPVVSDFSNELLDLVIFPEAYIRSDDSHRLGELSGLAKNLNVQLLVGVVKPHPTRPKGWQVLFNFRADGSFEEKYIKHSTAGALAFELTDWSPENNLPVFSVSGVKIGVTLCHDQYLGLLHKYLSSQGIKILINPSYDNVLEEKWSSILRLRAVENRVSALCTLHNNLSKRNSTHPYGFSSNGAELIAFPAGHPKSRMPLSKCRKPGIYIVDVPLKTEHARQHPGLLPVSDKNRKKHPTGNDKLISISLKNKVPMICDGIGWKEINSGIAIKVDSRRIMVGLIKNDELFQIEAFFRLLINAYKVDCKPLFWNIWDHIPADPERLLSIMMGRTIEFCSPVVLSDKEKIFEVIELANYRNSLRRLDFENSAQVGVDLTYAGGFEKSFKKVSSNVKGKEARNLAFMRYFSLLNIE